MPAGVNRISTLRKLAGMNRSVFILIFLTALLLAPIAAQAEDKPIDSNWYKSAFSDLWASHIERDPDIKLFEEKTTPNKSAKTLYRTWVTNQCITPGEKPYIAVWSKDEHTPDIVPAFHGSPKSEGKPILSPMDAATVQFTVELNHDRIEASYRNYIRETSEEKRERAKKTLIEMCGADAVKRLDEAVAKHKSREQG